ncbi:MAG: phosphatase PAP2 family protein, partial [Clostridia bacterium]|nr:phosphatase PAP2 family protein [Clostridia bacterium]
DIATLMACLFSLFGETIFLVVLLCAIYWIVNKQLGERIMLVTFSSMTVNTGLKNLFARPRPYTTGKVSRLDIDNPLISTTELHDLQSFPSGHSQMSGGLFFSCALHKRKAWGWILFPLLTLGVMLSRLYFGVHYPSDVLVGATFGIAFAFLWDWILKQKEGVLYLALALFALLSIGLVFLFPGDKTQVEVCAMSVAAAICLPLEHKFIRFENTSGAKNKVLRLLVGFLCVGIVYGGFSVLPFAFLELLEWKFIKYFLTVVVATLVAPALFKKFKI